MFQRTNRTRIGRAGASLCIALWLLLSVAAGVAQAGPSAGQAPVVAVDAIGMTVSDMDRAADFYSRVCQFRKLSDVEVAGPEYEQLQGVFGLRMRIVRMRLGDEFIELTEYLAPKGRPFPPRLAEQRPLVPAHRDDHQRHGPGLRLAAAEQGAAPLDRATAAARGESTAQRLLAARYRFVSPGLIAMPDDRLGFRKGLLARDPDGHVMQFVQR